MLSLILLAAVGQVLGDFDHDGRMDRALLRPAGAHYELVIERADGSVFLLLERVDNPANFYFEKLAPGVYETACAKGLGPRRPCPRLTVSATADTLQFGTPEASQAVAIWNGGEFEIDWLSD